MKNDVITNRIIFAKICLLPTKHWQNFKSDRERHVFQQNKVSMCFFLPLFIGLSASL